MLPGVVHAFRKNNLIIYLLMLFTLISTAKFDFKNICFLLFCDILRYWSTDSTSKMRYPFKETQQFWWLGKILFHGRFQRFMSGYKHAGQSNLTGYLNPATARINFSLPSHIHINEHPIDLKIPDIKGPGIFHEMIQLISSQKKNSYVLTFDGKKLAPGLTDEAGDIDLLGYGPEPLHQQHEQYTKSKEIISKITDYLQGSSKSDNYIKNSLLDVSHRVSKSIRDLRQLIAKQQYALDKFTTKAASEPGRNYCYVIDSIKTAIYRARSTIKDALATNDALFGFIALLLNSSGYCTEKMVNLSKTKSFVTLKEPRQVHSSLRLPETEHVPHHLLKQKSDEWFNLRKTVKVTGSTAYNALGIDGLKSQKETFQYINNQKEKPAPTEQQQMAMKHGTENEIHALATLHSKVMPAFFPNLTYYEEGLHMISANNQNIISVSPDGSLRRSENLSGVIEDIVYAVECKCPYSSYKFNTPVYYNIPTRYICQTMLEMRSMGCQECIFVCWTEESTTVFKLRLNQRLIALIINDTVDVFYSENDKPPSKLSSRAKEIKELCKDISDSSTFIGEFRSVLGTLQTNELVTDQNDLPYQTFKTTTPTVKTDYCEKEMISTLVSASTVLKEAYQLNRKKASEVIPIMLSTVDRISNPETGHAQPIGYFLRGYSLSTDIMRNIADDFMQACFVNGIHVPVQTFDGQWINLVVRDQQGNPQTKLQLQVDVWKEVKRMPKKDIVRKIRQLNKSKNVMSKLDGRTINVSGYTPRLPKTSYLIESAQSGIHSQASEVTDSIEIIGEVLDAVMTEDISGSEIISIQDTQYQIEEQNQEISNEAEEEVAEPMNNLDDINESIDDNTTSYANGFQVISSNMQPTDYENILITFSSLKRNDFWKDKTIVHIEEFFKVPSTLDELRDYELKALMLYLGKRNGTKTRLFLIGVSKEEKLKQLKDYNSKGTITKGPTRQRKKCISSLQELCAKELMKKNYPKEAIAASYAGYLYDIRFQEWVKSSIVSDPLDIENIGKISPYYHPEFSIRRNQIEIKVIDGTHIRNNIRAALCKDKITGIRKDAWSKVACRKESNLNMSLLEIQADGKVLDQQNEAYTRSFFTTDVQMIMLDFKDENGDEMYKEEAVFCQLIRNWIRAEDEQGLSSEDRLRYSISLKDWLLKDVNFNTFPPKTQYIKGIPRVTYESIICSIDAHIYLYKLTLSRTYNWRAISSLVAETFMSDIDYMDNWARNGVLTAHGALMHMKTVCALHTVQHDPDRSFHMRIAAAPVYRPTVIEQGIYDTTLQEPSTEIISKIVPRDHFFDRSSSMKQKVTFKGAKISKLDDPGRGVQPVRHHYKVDESKLLPSKRQGINLNDIDH